MSILKDNNKGTWTAQFYYTDDNGKKHRKRKTGFELKKDAQEYEINYLKKHDKESFCFDHYANLYLQDIKNRIKDSSYIQKKYLLDSKVIPFFHNRPMKEIQPREIRRFQNELLDFTQTNGKPYSPTYLKSIYNQLKAVFNYGVRFCDLKDNPCNKAGSFGSAKSEEKKFWTFEEYKRFQKVLIERNPIHSLAIEVLFFTGIRIGELLALTPSDIDAKNNIIHINKTYHKQNGFDIISLPKTAKSKRDITVPTSLIQKLKFYINSHKEQIATSSRIFSFSSAALRYSIRKYAPIAHVPIIRIHDLRHSHVSLLVNMGFNISVIADRLGHEKIQTTLDIYTHINQRSREEVSERLEKLLKSEKQSDIYDDDYYQEEMIS